MDRRDFLRGLGAVGALGATTAGCSALSTPTEADLYVSPEGDDDWSGERAEPGEDDGPFRTIERARDAVRERDWDGREEPIRVQLRGGLYRREAPLAFGPEDSGTPEAPVVYAAHPDEEPVITGARPVEGWEETTVNGVDAWTTTLPAVRDGDRYPRQLFVDGERRPRPRLPSAVDEVFEEGARVTDEEDRFYHFGEGTEDGRGKEFDTFVPESGSIDPDWHNRDDVEVVTIDRWYDERAPIDAVETDGERVEAVTVAFRPYYTKPWAGRFYYVENVFEALSDPGEWYLDRETGECWYVPREGESMEEVTIAVPEPRRLLEVRGTPDRPVRNLAFVGLTFAHTAWEYWERPDWITGQSAAPTVGALTLAETRDCRLDRCTVRTVGEYGIDLREGCSSVDLTRSEIHDTGAGGVKVGSYASRPDVSDARTGGNRVVDNHVHDTGKVFHMGAGVLAMDTYGNVVSHNHIHDCYYTGISCGFDWTFGDSPADDNRISYNHIHDLGQGLLSDMAGVYTLGVQPGTVVRNNHVHDVYQNDYGGWGLYPDQGSTGITWEDNLVHDTLNGFHLHFGADNLVRNNVLAGVREAAVKYSNGKTGGRSRYGLRMHGNVLVTDDAPTVTGGYDWSVGDGGVESDRNLLWDRTGSLDGDWWDRWRDLGHDRDSVVARPGFEDSEADDYRLTDDSPALDAPVSFERIDRESVGPRAEVPPAPPAGLAATLRDDGAVALSWPPVASATGYRVERSPADGDGERRTLADDLGDSSYTDADVGPGTYVYAVTTLAGDDESELSARARVDTNPPPSDLIATAAGPSSVRLDWTGTPVADAYRVRRAADREGPYEDVATVEGTTYLDEALDGETYFYAVRAVAGEARSERALVRASLGANARLQLHWPFDGEGDAVADASGHNLRGRTTGDVARVEGKRGDALRLAPDASVETAGLRLPTSSFSVVWWHYPRSRSDYNQGLGALNGWGTFLFHTDSEGGVYAGIDSGQRFTPEDLPAGTLELDAWQQFAFTWNRGRAAFYKNGEKLASTAGMGGSRVTFVGFALQSIDGRVDDVRLYEGALPGYRIADLYEGEGANGSE